MSMTFYCYREDFTRPAAPEGPADEYGDGPQPTYEERVACGWCDGPNFSNANAMLTLRSLGYDLDEHDGPFELDASDLYGRLVLASQIGGSIDDDGFDASVTAQPGRMTMIDCGVRPGYLADAYAAILPVAEQACAWDVDIIVA